MQTCSRGYFCVENTAVLRWPPLFSVLSYCDKVPRHFSHLLLPALVFLHCQNNDKNGEGVGKRCFVKCCETANCTLGQSQWKSIQFFSFSPLVGDKITERKFTWSVFREAMQIHSSQTLFQDYSAYVQTQVWLMSFLLSGCVLKIFIFCLLSCLGSRLDFSSGLLTWTFYD